MTPKTYTRTQGPWQQPTRTGHRLLCADGRIRAAELTSQNPDTFFSHPARVRLAGKWIAGYMTGDESPAGHHVLTFRPYQYEGKPPPPAALIWPSLPKDADTPAILEWHNTTEPEHMRRIFAVIDQEPTA